MFKFSFVHTWLKLRIHICLQTKGLHYLKPTPRDFLTKMQQAKSKNNRLIGLVDRVFTNGPGNLDSIPGRIIPKTLKMVLDTSLLDTHQYKVRIKSKVEQFRERSSTLPYTLVLKLLKREPSGYPQLRSPTLLTRRKNSSPLKLVDKFTYLGSSVSSTETDINMRLAEPWAAIDRLSVIWKSDLSDKMKCSFFQAAVVSILLSGCTTWTLTKQMEKRLDGNYTRTLRAILNKSWRQHPTKQQLYSHLPPIAKTIKIRQTRHAGNCWRSRDELISDVLLCTPTHGRAKATQPPRIYIQQLCVDTGCSPEDQLAAMDDREGWRERVRDICSDGATWWWGKRNKITNAQTA